MSGRTKGVRGHPSVAHLCQLIGRTPEETAKRIIDFQDKAISIRTWTAVDYLRSFLSGTDKELLIRQAKLDKNRYAGTAALETLPLVEEYKNEYRPDWFRPLSPIRIMLSRDLEVTLKPIGLVGVDEQTYVIAGQVWKNISLNPFAFRIWASILKVGLLDNNPDINGLHWLEMSAPKKGQARELNMRTLEAVDLLTELELAGIVRNLNDAMSIVRSVPKKKRPQRPNHDQPNLFDA